MAVKIITTDGTLVYSGRNGLDEASAQSSVQERNARAEKLGIKARYQTAPMDEEA